VMDGCPQLLQLPREAISCPLCEEPYATEEPRTPCVLPCFHTFCRECLGGWAAKGGADAAAEGELSCPTCRSACGTSVGALQVNFALMTVVEAERVSTGQTALVCQECDEGDAPSHYCEECGLLLCDACTNYHRTSKRFKGHDLQTVEEFKARKQALPRQKRMCKKHKDQAVSPL
jgi:tripartite motif-containing protein 56